jgi:hypothetical protein
MAGEHRTALNVAQALGINLVANLETVPQDPQTRSAFGFAVSMDIESFFEPRLTLEDLALWKNARCTEPHCINSKHPHESLSDCHRLYSKFDDTIMERAQTLGPRVYLSAVVLDRMFVWEHDSVYGLARLGQIGDAVKLAYKVRHGQDNYRAKSLESEWKPAKALGVGELKRLLRQRREYRRVNRRHREATYQDTCDWLCKTVEDSPQEFPYLRLNRESLSRYLKQVEEGDALRQRIVLSHVKPGELFDAWAAWSINMSRETFRRAVSLTPQKV